MALLALATASAETGPVQRDNEDASQASRWLFVVTDGMGGHAAGHRTTLTAMLLSGGRVTLVHIGGLPRVPAPRRPAPPARQGPHDWQTRHRRWLARRCSHGAWTAGRTVRPTWSCGPAGRRRYLLCADGSGPVVGDRPHRNVLTSRAIFADAPLAGRLSRGRAGVSWLIPYSLRMGRHAVQGVGSWAPRPPRMRALRSAAICRWRVRPRLPARCAKANRRTMTRA
jgi:hypothetical protein